MRIQCCRLSARIPKDRSASPFQRYWQTVQDCRTHRSKSTYPWILWGSIFATWKISNMVQYGTNYTESIVLKILEAMITMPEIVCRATAQESLVRGDGGEMILTKHFFFFNFRN